eukprot:43538_1
MHWIASSCTQIIALGCILRNFASLCDLFYLDHLNINYIIQPIYPTDFVMDYQELGAQFDWKTASKKQIDDAYQNNELIKVSSTTNSKCHAPSVSDHFTLLRHKTTTDDDESAAKIIDYSVCWKCDKLYTTKRNKNRDKSKLSYPNQNLRAHTCFKKLLEEAKKREEKENASKGIPTFRDELITQCRQIILEQGALPAIVEDIRPFSFTEGSGMKQYAKSLIRVGTILQVMPGDDVIDKLIPFRKACTTALKKRYSKDENALKNHFKVLNEEILPSFHLSFDLWTDRGKKHHYLGLMAHEVNKETKEMEVYCLEMIDWEELAIQPIAMDKE